MQMDSQQQRSRLSSEYESLEQLSMQTKDDRKPVTLDQQSVGRLSRMDALQKQNMDIATEQRRRQRMRAIKAALTRLDTGEYGFCVRCEEEIPQRRLDFDPAAAFCLSCQG